MPVTDRMEVLQRLRDKALAEEMQKKTWLACVAAMGVPSAERSAEKAAQRATDRLLKIEHEIEMELLRREIELRQRRFEQAFAR